MLPFTAEQFAANFTRYNEGVWPAQWILVLLAATALAMLRSGTVRAGRVIAAILAALWAWMALAYHLSYFREINRAAVIFAAMFLFAAGAFAWHGVARARMRFDWKAPNAASGWALMALALVVYPALGHALGVRYPAAPTFGLPCPTTLFTLGMLQFSASRLPPAVYAVPLLWTAIGGMAALQLGMRHDLVLPVAGLIAAHALMRPQPAFGRK